MRTITPLNEVTFFVVLSGDIIRIASFAESFCRLSEALDKGEHIQSFVETKGGYIILIANGDSSACILTDTTIHPGQIRFIIKKTGKGG